MFKGFKSTLDDGQTPIVTTGGVFVDAIPFDTTQITSAENGSNPKVGDLCHPLAAGAHAPAIAIQGNLIGRDVGGPQGVGASEDGVMCTLTKADVHGVAQPIAFHNRQDPDISGDVTHLIGAKDNGMGVAMSVALRGRDGGAVAELGGEVQHCLRASGGGGDKPHVLSAMQVRRLTPRECERLQGFPDNWTLIPWRGKEAPDGPRYKALGNSMAVPVMAWIGQRIDQVAAISAEEAAA